MTDPSIDFASASQPRARRSSSPTGSARPSSLSRSPRSLLAVAALLVASLGAACSGSDGPVQLVDSEITFSTADQAPSDEESGTLLEIGQSESLAPAEDRRALLTVLRGKVYNSGDQPFEAKLVRTIDAKLNRDVDTSTKGPDHWVTRAQVLDKDGNVLWSDRVNTLFQLLEYLKNILTQYSDVSFTIDQIYIFAKTQYPELLEFSVQVPLGLEGAETYRLQVPDADGELYEVGSWKIDALKDQAEPPQFDAETTTIVDNGPAEERIDVVILGDGYTDDQRGKFQKDAQAVADRFVTTPPFQQHAEAFNFHSIWTPSNESGAGYDCKSKNDTDCKDDFRDTYYNYVFAISALVDMFDLNLPASSARVALPTKVAKMYETAALVPYDEIIMLSNTDRRSGFAGMYVGVLTTFDDRKRFPDVAVHEFGHSFGVLGDEYMVQGDPCMDARPRLPLPANIAAKADPEAIKWSRWVEEGTPMPTPARLAEVYGLGAYRGAYNCQELFRPQRTCMMRRSGKPFCPVCAEQLVRRIYSDLDVVKPGYPKVKRLEGGTLRFEAGVHRHQATPKTTWTLDGEPVARTPTLNIGGDRASSEWKKLELKVRKDAGFVRKDDPRLKKSFSWWVRAK